MAHLLAPCSAKEGGPDPADEADEDDDANMAMASSQDFAPHATTYAGLSLDRRKLYEQRTRLFEELLAFFDQSQTQPAEDLLDYSSFHS